MSQDTKVNMKEDPKLHTTSTAIIHISVRANCNTDQAFSMFTRNDLLESWLTTRAEVEPRAGGKYELFWNPSDRENDSTLGCKVTTIVEPSCLSFTWKGPKEYKHFMNEADPLTHVSVFFIPLSSGSQKPLTEIHLIHSGWRGSREWQDARDYFVRNWLSAFKDMQEKCVESLVKVKENK